MRPAAASVPDRTLRDAETSLREARIKLLNDQQALVNLGLPVRLEELASLPDEKLVQQVRLLGLPPAADPGSGRGHADGEPAAVAGAV